MEPVGSEVGQPGVHSGGRVLDRGGRNYRGKNTHKTGKLAFSPDGSTLSWPLSGAPYVQQRKRSQIITQTVEPCNTLSPETPASPSWKTQFVGAGGVKVSLSCIYTWQLSFRGLTGSYVWDTDTYTPHKERMN